MGTLQCIVNMYRHVVLVLALVASPNGYANEQPWHTDPAHGKPQHWHKTPYTNSNGHPMPKYYHISDADMKWEEALEYCKGVHVPEGRPGRDSTLWCPTRPEEVDGVLAFRYYMQLEYKDVFDPSKTSEDFIAGVWTGLIRTSATLNAEEVREDDGADVRIVHFRAIPTTVVQLRLNKCQYQ